MFFSKQLLSLAGFFAVITLASAQGCSRTATVRPNDNCDTLGARESVSKYQLTSVNKGLINEDCTNLRSGQELCLGWEGQDCDTVAVVRAGESCLEIAGDSQIPHWVLAMNNPNVGQYCTRIYPGLVLCTSSQIYDYT